MEKYIQFQLGAVPGHILWRRYESNYVNAEGIPSLSLRELNEKQDKT